MCIYCRKIEVPVVAKYQATHQLPTNQMENPVYKLYFTDRSDGQPEYITWKPNPIPVAIAQNVLLEVKPGKLDSEEVLELVELWYRTKGQEVPEDERKSCLEAIEAEKEERANPKPVEYVTQPAKPEYGTPAFWKDYWARRKAAEAAGLPWPPSKAKKAKAAKN